MPRDAVIAKNDPPLVSNFAFQRADGAELALNFYQMVAIDGACRTAASPGARLISGSRTPSDRSTPGSPDSD